MASLSRLENFRLEQRFSRYAFALAVSSLSLVLTLYILRLIGQETFQLAIVAVVLSAWYGGLGPGLFSAILLSAAHSFFILEPRFSFAINGFSEALRLGVFIFISVVMSVLSDARHRAERGLRTRTAELEIANRELEAFSYSVSHDLRSPLRVIDNHARVALEALSSASILERSLYAIRSTAQQTGQLVDDLLSFSRLGRQPLHKRPTDPTELVQGALKDLHQEQEDRSIEIVVGDLPVCQADPALLRIVYVNLLQNALKFTRRQERARIEIGRLADPTGPIYYVKDNGIGFDMQFTQQLFGMFQRLHRGDEFEGSGVGLAIVRRIIERHGGRIWAEAAMDKGATFYFTLAGTEAR
jgi:light-regulated signal transduction histidine kinase (bacteriophytochrome)